MGYWSNRPMDGDLLWDIENDIFDGISEITSRLKKIGTYDYDVEREVQDQVLKEIANSENNDFDYLKYALSNAAQEIRDIREIKDDISFVLPFMFIERNIKLKNKVLAEYFKSLLVGSDGLSKYRGYKYNESTYKKDGKLRIPKDYIDFTLDNWDRIMFDESTDNRKFMNQYAVKTNTLGGNLINTR